MKFYLLLNIDNPKEFKIHFAIGPIDRKEPLYEFWKGNFSDWQARQNKKNFQRKYILSLIFYDPGEWLYAGIYESKGVSWTKDYYEYDTDLTDMFKSLIGRLIIKYVKPFRSSYVNLENYMLDLEISEVLKNKSTFSKFPGYDKVKIDFTFLKAIMEENEVSWKTALENMKGIYLITNKENGKLYIGSAYGNNALWSRLQSYISTGHGGNKELIKLISNFGIGYAEKYFQFSLLEIIHKNLSDEEIIERENYWKEVLMTREFGYNQN